MPSLTAQTHTDSDSPGRHRFHNRKHPKLSPAQLHILFLQWLGAPAGLQSCALHPGHLTRESPLSAWCHGAVTGAVLEPSGRGFLGVDKPAHMDAHGIV